jgi:hypothetical protein
MRSRLALVAVLAALAALPGCGVRGLAFVQDDRVDIVRPNDRDKVKLPVRIEWTAKDFSGGFGVLLDQAPPRPGKSLAWLFRGSDSCRGKEGTRLCATPEYLAQRNVFETATPRYTIEHVPRLTGNDRRRQFHEITVVLLDAHGRRVGEGAWSVQFEVEKPR